MFFLYIFICVALNHIACHFFQTWAHLWVTVHSALELDASLKKLARKTVGSQKNSKLSEGLFEKNGNVLTRGFEENTAPPPQMHTQASKPLDRASGPVQSFEYVI